MKLLKSVQAPAEVAVMYCKAHQSGSTTQNQGNKLADWAAKRAAEKGIQVETFVITPEWKTALPDKPLYDKQDSKLIETLKAEKPRRWMGGHTIGSTGSSLLPHE